MYSAALDWKIEKYSSLVTKIHRYCIVDCCSEITQSLNLFVQVLSRKLEKTVEAAKSTVTVLFCGASGTRHVIRSLSKILEGTVKLVECIATVLQCVLVRTKGRYSHWSGSVKVQYRIRSDAYCTIIYSLGYGVSSLIDVRRVESCTKF